MAESPTVVVLPEKFRRAYARFTEIRSDLQPRRIIGYNDYDTWGALYIEAVDPLGRIAKHQVLVFGEKSEYDFSNLGKRL